MSPPPLKGRATHIDVAIGRRVKKRRETLNLTQNHLAKELGISFQQLQKYESGLNRISAGKLIEIARILDLEPSLLLQGRDALRDGAQTGYESAPVPQDVADLMFYYSTIKDAKIKDQIIQFVKVLASNQ